MNDCFLAAYMAIRSKENLAPLLPYLFEKLLASYRNYTPTWHALGFVHCKLAECNKGTLRLHIWPKGQRDKREQVPKIHDHIFSLDSYVITGNLRNNQFFLLRQPEVTNKSLQKYRVVYTKDGSMLIPMSEFFEIEISHSHTISTGGYYSIQRGVFHESCASKSEQVVTLVATYDHLEADPYLLGDHTKEGRIYREKVLCSYEDWVLQLKNVHIDR